MPKRKESNGKCGVKEQKAPYTAEDVRFTVNNGHLFAMILAIPEDRVVIKSLSTHLTWRVKSKTFNFSAARLDFSGNRMRMVSALKCQPICRLATSRRSRSTLMGGWDPMSTSTTNYKLSEGLFS